MSRPSAPSPLPVVLLCLTLGSMALGCSTAHHARPLGQGNHAIHVTMGGPIAGIGEPSSFIPLTTVTYKYGLTDRADLHAGWHVLETFINNGNFYFDIGASYYVLEQKGARPGISTAFTVSPLINETSGWVSFDLQATASWAIGKKKRHLIYFGFHNYFTPVGGKVLDTPIYTWSPYLGGQLRLGPNREIGLGLEIKWLRPYGNGALSTLQFLGIDHQGAFTFLGGVTVYIPKGKKNRDEGAEEVGEGEER